MKLHSEMAWEIASKFNNVLASETRDLAALIDEALKKEYKAGFEDAKRLEL